MRRVGALVISIAALGYAVAVVIVSWQAPDKGFLTFRGRRVVIVEPGSEAEAAGIRRDDVVVAIDGEPIASTLEYANRLNAREPGERVRIDFERPPPDTDPDWDSETVSADITLAESPTPIAAIAAVGMALILLALGLIAVFSRPVDRAAWHFWQTSVVFAVIYAGALSWVHLV